MNLLVTLVIGSTSISRILTIDGEGLYKGIFLTKIIIFYLLRDTTGCSNDNEGQLVV